MQALQVFTWGQRASAGLVAASALLAAAAPGAGQASVVTWTALLGMAVLGVVASWQCGVMRQQFIFVDYVHAER